MLREEPKCTDYGGLESRKGKSGLADCGLIAEAPACLLWRK